MTVSSAMTIPLKPRMLISMLDDEPLNEPNIKPAEQFFSGLRSLTSWHTAACFFLSTYIAYQKFQGDSNHPPQSLR